MRVFEWFVGFCFSLEKYSCLRIEIYLNENLVGWLC